MSETTTQDEVIFKQILTGTREEPTGTDAFPNLNQRDEHSHDTIGGLISILLRTYADGRKAVFITIRNQSTGVRASGKRYVTFDNGSLQSFTTSKHGYIIHRTITNAANSASQRQVLSSLIYKREAASTEALSQTNTVRVFDKISGILEQWKRKVMYQHGADIKAITNDEINELARRITAFLGDTKTYSELYPMLRLKPEQPGTNSSLARLPYLHAQNFAEVARNAFGKTRYRKPLGAQVARSNSDVVAFYRLFRGLVPIDWIIDAMRATPDGEYLRSEPNRGHYDKIRKILTKLPQEVLARLLKQPIQQLSRSLSDCALSINAYGGIRDLGELGTLVAARGQRNIRDSRDVETLVRILPIVPIVDQAKIEGMQARRSAMAKEQALNRARKILNADRVAQGLPELTWEEWRKPEVHEALMDEVTLAEVNAEERYYADQRKQKAEENVLATQWLQDIKPRIDGAVLPGPTEEAPAYRIKAAASHTELALWGAALNHCIGEGYYAQLLDIDLLLGLYDTSSNKLISTAHVKMEHGLTQIFAKHNTDIAKVMGVDNATHMIKQLIELGISVNKNTWGIAGVDNEVLASLYS